MSWDYGWNAQSSLLPEKQVRIQVGDKGNQKIKAIIFLTKQKMKKQGQDKQFPPHLKAKQPNKNKGIEERIKKDSQAQQLSRVKNDKSIALIRQKLQKKQKIYELQQKNPHRNDHLFLVDFVQKQLSKQDEQFEELKRQFYAGKLNQVLKQQQKIHQEQKANVHDYIRENLAWEKEILEQLNGQLIQAEKAKVAQSFDRKLSQDQKKALERVICERLREKERISQIKKQREQDQFQRIRKLKKLQILEDSDQEVDK